MKSAMSDTNMAKQRQQEICIVADTRGRFIETMFKYFCVTWARGTEYYILQDENFSGCANRTNGENYNTDGNIWKLLCVI